MPICLHAPSLAVRAPACKPGPFDERDKCVAKSSSHPLALSQRERVSSPFSLWEKGGDEGKRYT
jgi:hypothetical protein